MYSIYTLFGEGGGQFTARMTVLTLIIMSYFIHVFYLHVYRGIGGRHSSRYRGGGGAFYSTYDR